MAWETVATAQVSNTGIQGNIWRSLERLPVGTTGRFLIRKSDLKLFQKGMIEVLQ